jgi:hypothetical protein
VNGGYATFTTKSTTEDVYVLNPIKEKKTIAVTTADIVVDEEATASATDGSTVYIVENGAISADKADFFVKNLTFSVLKDAMAQYQVPEGQEAYIKMSDTNITFLVAAGETVKVKVVTSKNSCKMLNNEDESKIDRKCYVNVSGTTYGNEDVTAENGNIIEFELKGGNTSKQKVKDAEGNDVIGEDGKAVEEDVFTPDDTYYTFLKYTGTGNILISSIEITPVESTGISAITNVEEKAKDAIFNLAGQQVDKTFKGVVIKNGKKMIQK